MKPFAVDRVLLVTDTVERLTANERLTALVKARAGRRPLTLTVSAGPDEAPSAIREGLGRVLDEQIPSSQPALELRVANRSESIDSLLEAHDAILLSGAAGDRQLIVTAWQRGLCVINAVEQAEEVAALEELYFEGGVRGGRPWYSIMEGNPVIVTNPQHIVLGYGARINPRAVIHNESVIEIGRGSLLGADAELNLYTAKLTIGQFCHISSYFAAIGSRHTLQCPATFAVSRGPYAFLGQPADKVSNIVIGNDVWFGTRTVVLPGVHVADGCVVGAGSVVTKGLREPYGIYAGNPAKLIRFRFPAHVIKWLCAIQWWNWSTAKLWQARTFFRTDISGKTEKDLWQMIESMDRDA